MLGTIATNHTRALEATHHPIIGSVLAGDHLAFAIGATAVGAGILVALTVLRRSHGPEPEVVVDPEILSNREFAPLARQAA